MIDTTTTLLIAALSSGGAGAIVASIINARSSKKKLGAEATEAIQRAASGVVADLERQVKYRDDELEMVRREHRSQVASMTAEHTAAIEKLTAAHAEERDQWRHTLQLHVAWDWLAIEKLALLNVTLPDPPPILVRLSPSE